MLDAVPMADFGKVYDRLDNHRYRKKRITRLSGNYVLMARLMIYADNLMISNQKFLFLGTKPGTGCFLNFQNFHFNSSVFLSAFNVIALILEKLRSIAGGFEPGFPNALFQQVVLHTFGPRF